jgi:hypothetical protein
MFFFIFYGFYNNLDLTFRFSHAEEKRSDTVALLAGKKTFK